MSLERRIFYNTIAQSAGKIGAAVLGLITISLLSRYLAEAGFGQYSTVIAFMGVFVTLADLGLYLIVLREISKDGTDKTKILSNALGLRFATALAMLFFGAVLALAFPYDPVVKKTMFLGIGAFLFVSLNQVLIGVFQKHLVQYLVVLSETAGRAINLLLVYLFIQTLLPLPFFILALLLGNAINFSLTFFWAKRYERFGIAFDFMVWKQILLASWPLTFAVLLNLLYFKTDTVILSVFHSEEAVGIYSLPYKLLEGFLAFPAMFVGLIMPLLSQSAFVSWEKFKQILQQAFDSLLLMAIPVLISIQFFAQDIINLLKGERQYLDSSVVLKILVLAAVTIFFGTLFGYAVVAVNKQKTMIKGYLLGAATGLVLYFALIPKFSYWGAAWGTVASEIVVTLFAYFLVRKASGSHVSFRLLPLALPAAAGLVIFFALAKFFWIWELLLGGIVYLLILAAFKAIPIKIVKELLFLQ
ncbi:MAG: flippase [Candidatus Doudnabacteria bacterium]|nr:flippase [Candidatus Doudnabacteria bacterium]